MKRECFVFCLDYVRSSTHYRHQCVGEFCAWCAPGVRFVFPYLVFRHTPAHPGTPAWNRILIWCSGTLGTPDTPRGSLRIFATLVRTQRPQNDSVKHQHGPALPRQGLQQGG